jgi:hypothetical protein
MVIRVEEERWEKREIIIREVKIKGKLIKGVE